LTGILTVNNSKKDSDRVPCDRDFMVISAILPAKESLFSRLGVFQAPILTVGHQCIGTAAILGFLWVITHFISIIVTCIIEGFDWGTTAWCMDITGFIAGFGFAFLCQQASNKHSAEVRQDNIWIIVWAGITFFVRIVDTLMLLGIVELSNIYVEPTGAVLYSNILSEILIGNAYTITALIGSVMLVLCPEDGDQVVSEHVEQLQQP